MIHHGGINRDRKIELMIDAMTGTGLISHEEACERLVAHKSYKTWSDKHGEALRKRIAL